MQLRTYLSLHHISETAFAKQIGFSQAAVNRYCRGRVPATDALRAIIQATNGAVTANDFFSVPSAEINSHPINPNSSEQLLIKPSQETP
ncbi:MAG: helix-turn-helix domain-containing protein [Rhodospirillaceae bacterium]|nr:helix-turn-helix domain-containing protein [Rhodospirillaceae bacterium]